MGAQPAISETELEILKVLWEHGAGTVREIHELLADQGRTWAYTTVLTFLQRLQGKGFVSSDKSAVAHVYRAAVSRDKLVRRRVKDLAAQLCDGMAAPVVLALLKGQRFSPLEIDEFRKLLDELDLDSDAEKESIPDKGSSGGKGSATAGKQSASGKRNKRN